MIKFKVRKEDVPYWFGAIVVIFIICFALMFFSEAQIPTIFTSSGIVSIISAFIGVLVTVFVTSIMLGHQSDTEAQKDKDVEIHKEKIKVFSDITSKLWATINVDKDPNIIFEELKDICFDKLIFYLNKNEIIALKETIDAIDANKLTESDQTLNISIITNILQNSLDNKQDKKLYDVKNLKENAQYLNDLYQIFTKKQKPQEHQNISSNMDSPITFWHFNMWDDAQIDAFKNDNWILSLFECEEDWRTNLLMQVNAGDVIFLFRRGGYGYIGAFKAKETKAYTRDEWDKLTEKNKNHNIYNAFEMHEATIVSNIIVEPIAYNCEGVGYLTVRRRTIERIYDEEAIKFLLNRFSGNDLEENILAGKGKFDNGNNVKLNDGLLGDTINKFNKQSH
jgi:energy-coupling factor transporter transmembrane protein EcfT